MAETEAGELGRLTVTITPESREILRRLIERRYPGRRGMASVVVEEALRRLNELDERKRAEEQGL